MTPHDAAGRARRIQKDALVALVRQPAGLVDKVWRVTGYADASRFGVHFRRRYGLTPRAYRQRFGVGRRAEAEG
jgi:transcriptional regulator GlxA family with amidase domain